MFSKREHKRRFLCIIPPNTTKMVNQNAFLIMPKSPYTMVHNIYKRQNFHHVKSYKVAQEQITTTRLHLQVATPLAQKMSTLCLIFKKLNKQMSTVPDWSNLGAIIPYIPSVRSPFIHILIQRRPSRAPQP